MIEEFLKRYTILIAEYPGDVRVEKVLAQDGVTDVIIYAHKADTGKLIGKDGKTISSIKTVINGYKIKDSTQYRLIVKPVNE